MADITDPSGGLDHASPGDDLAGNGVDSRGTKRPRASMAGDDDDDDDEKGGRERRKIEIKFIQDKSRRHITFSKRKAGIMKKAYELSVLTGTQVLLLVVSETGLVYTFTTPKLQPLVTKAEGKNLIQACLNAPEPSGNENGVDAPDDVPSPEDVPPMPPAAGVPRAAPHTGYAMTPEQQQAMYYQQMQQQNQGGQYGGMPQMPQHQRA
ncbi:MADS-box transcription factor, other eukaryote [Cladophialophora yegresii CBS 114405]|uniref:MADS-box transcription factor, other eukaryote n=1 Tax=Cladophialophora yegresii CBS 114405 TaxID=1182544 RepID=W9WC28_9EURO|nr:MADS-box transcription factor, other eukaryote [Cladophialophora yegresii CBS 114405]EXJ62540.1 MADS-box transcription factor, other eukaryote [Cladophialophora yegresii CBS 114405]